MLDDLLGRTALKERIDELEAEASTLRDRLEAESDRRADAVSARQAAEERCNRLEDRIADLEGRLDRAAEDAGSDPSFRRRTSVRGGRCDAVLDRLASLRADGEGALTAMIDGPVPDPVGDVLGDRAHLAGRAAPCVVVADDAGLVAGALVPPVPPEPFVRWGEAFSLERGWFLPEGRHAVALVRADLFAVGTYESDERVAFEGFESDVRSDHSKGGFSQDRFERRREEQIDEHLAACRSVLDDLEVDPLYVLGDQQLVGNFDAAASGAVDATGEPEAALSDAVRDFWTTRVYGL